MCSCWTPAGRRHLCLQQGAAWRVKNCLRNVVLHRKGQDVRSAKPQWGHKLCSLYQKHTQTHTQLSTHSVLKTVCWVKQNFTWWNFCYWHSAGKLWLVKVGADTLHDDNGKLGLQSGEKNGIGWFILQGWSVVGGLFHQSSRVTFTALTMMENLGVSYVNQKIPAGLRLLECSRQR